VRIRKKGLGGKGERADWLLDLLVHEQVRKSATANLWRRLEQGDLARKTKTTPLGVKKVANAYNNQKAFGVGGITLPWVYTEEAVCIEARMLGSSEGTGLLSRAAMRERRALSPAPARTVPRLATELERERERLTVDIEDFRDREDRSEKGLCCDALKKGLLPVARVSASFPSLKLCEASSLKGSCTTSVSE